MKNLKKGMRILIPFDGSVPSKKALDQALNLAQITDSEIVVLSVVPEINIPFPSDDVLRKDPAKSKNFQEEIERNYAETLSEAAEDITNKYPEQRIETKLERGSPSKRIVDFAEKGEFDLIVMGSKGLGGIRGLILGSTSRRVVNSCTIPVLIVK